MFNWWPSTAGRSRRAWLKVGAAGVAGLTLPHLLRAEATRGASPRSIINIHLDGGPPQLDTIDLKPLAPTEIRGEFSPIATSVPGIAICELMPRLAATAHRFAWIRTLVGSAGAHDGFQTQSGFLASDLQGQGGRPAVGCVLAKLQAHPHDATPYFIDLMQGRPLVRNSARPGFLGPAVQPFRPDVSRLFPRELEPGMVAELSRLGADHQTSLTLNSAISLDRLASRRLLLSELDGLRRTVDASGMMDAMDQFGQQAVSILTSSRLADALDPMRERSDVLDRYRLRGHPTLNPLETNDGPDSTLKFLLARRLVEAGARCVSLSFGDFDTHSNNFPTMRYLLPLLDHGLATLVDDLDERGLLETTLIVVWGEFGRTPRIDPKTGGRHHWPQVAPAILAGGGLRTGQVIGATDRDAGSPVERPVHFKDVIALMYRQMGIDPHRTTLLDPHGRPQHLLDAGECPRELV